MNPVPLNYLLEGEPWIEYRARLDLLDQSGQDPLVQAARAGLLGSPLVQNLVSELGARPWQVISSHKSAGQPFHKLTFLADLGLKAGDAGIGQITDRIMQHTSDEGPFQLPVNIPAAYGGSGQESSAWALCDAPLLVYALVKFGLSDELAVQNAINHLAGLLRHNGWPCVVSKELGSFRGPGRKDDPCPFANLAMLKLVAELDDWRDSPASHTGAETLLALWSESANLHPYMFFMGSDFRKLKVPFVWYDLLHVLDVLSRFPWLRNDARLLDMLALLKSKASSDGLYTPESIWMAWQGWEFGQKKSPSRWLTLCAWRIIHRFEMVPAAPLTLKQCGSGME